MYEMAEMLLMPYAEKFASQITFLKPPSPPATQPEPTPAPLSLLLSPYEYIAASAEGQYCWGWSGNTQTHMAGGRHYHQPYLVFKKQRFLVHRFLLAWWTNAPLDGFTCRNQCGNSVCVNPAHWMTPADLNLNLLRGAYRGRIRMNWPRIPESAIFAQEEPDPKLGLDINNLPELQPFAGPVDFANPAQNQPRLTGLTAPSADDFVAKYMAENADKPYDPELLAGRIEKLVRTIVQGQQKPDYTFTLQDMADLLNENSVIDKISVLEVQNAINVSLNWVRVRCTDGWDSTTMTSRNPFPFGDDSAPVA